MKKILLIAAVFCLISNLPAMADDETELVPGIEDSGRGRLVSDNHSTMNSKLNELERRVNDLERDRRSNDDKIRQIDREVNDLKRRF